MERYYINILVGDSYMRVTHDRDNERLVLVPVEHVQPNESIEFYEATAHNWMSQTNWSTLSYELIEVDYTSGEF